MSALQRPVAVIAIAEFNAPSEGERNEVEMLIPVIREAKDQIGFEQSDIDFTVSGSSDYLQGFPFAFVAALDAVGAWPPIRESHVEMDGAFALYEAVEVLQHGDLQTALVYAFARPSRGNLDAIMALQLDPYLVAPLVPDARSVAGLQAQAMRDSGRFGDVAPVPPTVVEDGCVALILATGDRARSLSKNPAWITGIDQRIEAPSLGARDLTRSPSARAAAQTAGLNGGVDAAFLHALYPHQAQLLAAELELGSATIDANAGPMMVGGLQRIAAAAKAISGGGVRRAIAHATSGPCLQQNLVAVLEASS